MSFPRYPRYKQSGVEWLGEVPEHWRVMPLGRLTLSRCDGPFGSGLKSEHYTDSGVRVVRLQNIRAGSFDGTDEAFVNAAYYECELSGHDVVGGDILIAGLGDDNNTVGRACVAPVGIEPAMVKADCFRFRLDTTQATPGFIAAALTAGASADAGVLSSGSTRSRIPLSVMASRKIPIPPLPEQSQIIKVLDGEAAKIDALIAEQQRLMNLLKEKRQATISHAVTRGLNPKARMKDSGIAWIGNVPAHWDIVPVWLLFELGRGRVISHEEIDNNKGEFPVYSSQTEGDGAMGSINTYDFEGEYLTWTTDGANAGTVFRRSGRFNCTNVCGTLKPREPELVLDYCWHALSASTEAFVRYDINPKLMNNVMAKIRLPVPPTAEQRQIASLIAAETSKLDALVAEAQRAIDLLQERRTALISAAVTGQIDVRGLAS